MPDDPTIRLILVGDNPDETELYQSGLEPHGFLVHTVPELDALPDAVARHAPRIVVFNLRLGHEKTWALLEHMHCGAALSVPGVILTGSVREDAANRIRARLNGCAAFIAKPCTADALAAVLRAVLAGARDLVVMDPARFAEGLDQPRQPGEGHTDPSS